MPNSCCDLHLHTYYSDGRAAPAEVVRHAAGSGLTVIAIADHDTVDGLEEAGFVSERLGLELIPAVELSTSWIQAGAGATRSPEPERAGLQIEPGCPVCVDILGYGIDPHHPALAGVIGAGKQDLHARVARCCELLTQDGWPVTLGEVLEENPRFPGPYALQRALWHKGYAASTSQAFPRFRQAWSQVPPPRLATHEAVESIHQAGGVAVLAHPISFTGPAGLPGADQISALKDTGLDGIEVLHPRLDETARRHFIALAERFDLVVTGGSDEHGWPAGFPRMGSQLVTYTMVRRLQERIASRSAQAG